MYRVVAGPISDFIGELGRVDIDNEICGSDAARTILFGCESVLANNNSEIVEFIGGFFVGEDKLIFDGGFDF